MKGPDLGQAHLSQLTLRESKNLERLDAQWLACHGLEMSGSGLDTVSLPAVAGHGVRRHCRPPGPGASDIAPSLYQLVHFRVRVDVAATGLFYAPGLAAVGRRQPEACCKVGLWQAQLAI